MPHRWRHPGVLAVIGLIGAAGLSACSTPAAGDDDGGRPLVGVAMPTTASERWIADGENVQTQLEALAYRVDLRYAEDDVPTQIDQLEEMIAEGADALVIGSIDGVALKGVLAEAAAADIPVIAYDRLIRESGDVDYYASFDNARVGVQQATTLLQGLGLVDAAGEPTGVTGPFTIELFAGSADDNNATVFYDGAMQVLQPYLDAGTLVVGSGQTAFDQIATERWDPEVAATRMAELMPRYTGDTRLAGVLSPYDGISIAVLEAATAAGYGSADRPLPVVTGQDAELASAKSVAAGEQYATIFKDTRQLAEVAVQMVHDLIRGVQPEVNDTTSYDNGVTVVPAYLLAPQVVTEENLTAVLVDGGTYTAQELS